MQFIPPILKDLSDYPHQGEILWSHPAEPHKWQDSTLHPRTFLSLKWSQPCNTEEEAVLALITLLFMKCTLPGSLPVKFDALKLSPKKKILSRKIIQNQNVRIDFTSRTCFKGSNVMHVFVILYRIYIMCGIQVSFLRIRYFHVMFLSAVKKFCQIFTVYFNRRKPLLYQKQILFP